MDRHWQQLVGALALAATASGVPAVARAQDVKAAPWGIEFAASAKAAAHEQLLNGLTAYHLFMFEDAIGHFRAARRLEPSFAMAYWGEALAKPAVRQAAAARPPAGSRGDRRRPFGPGSLSVWQHHGADRVLPALNGEESG
jgi:hypothetical protein